MKVNIFDFPVGTYRASTDTSMAAQLGSLATQGGNMYRLVQAAAAIATPAGYTVASATASGTKSWSVSLTSVAVLAPDGIIPAAYGSTTIPINSYFWIQVSGIVPAVCASTLAVSGASATVVLVPTTAGTLTLMATGVEGYLAAQASAWALNTAVLTAAGGTINVQLTGLV
jgi:hypothetical protein